MKYILTVAALLALAGCGNDGINGLQGQAGAAGQAGANGKDGANGLDGLNSLINTSRFTSNLLCASGAGTLVQVGMDLDRSNSLDNAEVSQTSVVCDGTNGVDGTNGTNGVDGQNGQDGTNGTNGIDGQNGTNGIDGKDGTNGVDGQNGQDGTNGIDGQNGQDGTNGTNGTNAVPPSITVYQFPAVNSCVLVEGAYVKRTLGASLEWHNASNCGDAAIFSSKNIVQLSSSPLKLLYIGDLESNPAIMTATVIAY